MLAETHPTLSDISIPGNGTSQASPAMPKQARPRSSCRVPQGKAQPDAAKGWTKMPIDTVAQQRFSRGALAG